MDFRSIDIFMNWFDYNIILLYLMGLILVGFLLKKKASQSLEDYYVAGRRLPWWALGMSGMASYFDITGTMLITAFLFMMGPKGLYIEFRGGAGLVIIFMMLWLGKWHRRSKCITGAEWMRYRFGNSWQGHVASLIMAISYIITTVTLLAYLSKGVGIFLSTFFPFTPLQCAITMFAIATVYTLFSGFYGVVVTDMIQSFIIIFTVIFISVFTVNKIMGLQVDLAFLASNVTGNDDWISIVPKWWASFQKGYQEYNLFLISITFFILKAVQQGLGEGWDPKYFGARNDRECGLLTLMWTGLFMLRWPLMMSFAILGIILVSNIYPDKENLVAVSNLIHQNFGDVAANQWGQILSKITTSPEKFPQLVKSLELALGNDWQDKVLLAGYHPGTVNPERILAESIRHFINPGVRGLILIAFISASMSSFDSIVNKAAGFFVRDIYQKYIKPDSSNKKLIFVSHWIIITMVGSGLLMGYFAKNINDIWSWLMMGLGAGLSIPLILRLYWWRFNGCGFLAGTLTGLTAAVIQRILFGDINVFVSFVLLTLISLIASVVGTYLAKPTSEEDLEHFYKTTRPFGFWKPYEKYLSSDLLNSTRKEHRKDIIAVPFAMLWYITLLLLPMQIITLNFNKEFWGTVILFIVSLVIFYKIWLKNIIYPKDAGIDIQLAPDFPSESVQKQILEER